MCSIFGVFKLKRDAQSMRELAVRQSRLMRHRGPDWSGFFAHDNAVLAHERLAIVDINNGAQPLISASGRQALAVNGEIYNHQALRATLGDGYEFTTESDCEVIIPLYLKHGSGFLNRLQGMFAFALYDAQQDRYLIARDPIGIIPLYYGYDELGQLFVASEMKALGGVCRSINVFPPGHFLDSRDGEIRCYYEPTWRDYNQTARTETDPKALREALAESVHAHLMSDVPYGVLLSGGLDSSVIAVLAKQFAHHRVEDHDQSRAWWPRLHSFAIGLKGSPDLAAAQKVADHIGTVHHGFEFTLQNGLDALHDVIWHLETYDVTTIRASTPMFLMARKIRAMGIKMVLSGEGSDEIFGGYLYFHKAPDAKALHQETVRKLDRLHLYDCLRANKAMSAWGVEARVPFLDRRFLDAAMGINPADKLSGGGRIEKHLLREAFSGELPDEVLWRQKEQFSDGVGYSWIDGLKEYAERKVSDSEMAAAAHRFPVNTPATKEAYWYRSQFETLFPSAAAADTVPGGASVACSSPEALAWDPALQSMNDPSGRAAIGVHENAYG